LSSSRAIRRLTTVGIAGSWSHFASRKIVRDHAQLVQCVCWPPKICNKLLFALQTPCILLLLVIFHVRRVLEGKLLLSPRYCFVTFGLPVVCMPPAACVSPAACMPLAAYMSRTDDSMCSIGRYELRPEIAESLWWLHHTTKKPAYSQVSVTLITEAPLLCSPAFWHHLHYRVIALVSVNVT
jgi:hypothetical protein